MENEIAVIDAMHRCKAVVADGHFVYTSGKHGDTYVNKDALYPHADLVSGFCRAIAERFAGAGVDAVVGPEKGGIILSQWVAYHLSKLERREVSSVFAEKEESIVLPDDAKSIAAIRHVHLSHGVNDSTVTLHRGERLVKKSDRFAFKRGYGALVKRKNVLVVEDVLNTFTTVNGVIDAIKAHNGYIIGVGALCDRSDLATRISIHFSPRTVALVRLPLCAWDANECPLCAKGIPVRTDLGKGADFLASKMSA